MLLPLQASRPSVLAVDGRSSLGVVDAFAHSFKYFLGELTKILDRQTNNKASELAITWVITVPAIWNDAAKAIMVCTLACHFRTLDSVRSPQMEAARKAGLESGRGRVVVALEPECASLYIKNKTPIEMKAGVQASPMRCKPNSDCSCIAVLGCRCWRWHD